MSHRETNNILQVNGPKSSSPSFKRIPGKTVIFKKNSSDFVHSHYSIYEFTCKHIFSIRPVSDPACVITEESTQEAFIHPIMTHLISMASQKQWQTDSIS